MEIENQAVMCTYTLDDYLVQERVTENRHEYLDGMIYALTGETLEHSLATKLCFDFYGYPHGRVVSAPTTRVLAIFRRDWNGRND